MILDKRIRRGDEATRRRDDEAMRGGDESTRGGEEARRRRDDEAAKTVAPSRPRLLASQLAIRSRWVRLALLILAVCGLAVVGAAIGGGFATDTAVVNQSLGPTITSAPTAAPAAPRAGATPQSMPHIAAPAPKSMRSMPHIVAPARGASTYSMGVIAAIGNHDQPRINR